MHESSEHAALLHLLRVAPRQAARLLRRVFGITVPRGAAQVVDPVHKPGSLVPDLVIVFCDPLDPGTPKLVLIVEVQRRIDPHKLLVWPAYLWLERLRRGCACQLLVLTPDPAVAAWAEAPITCGPGNRTQALVLGPGRVPWITRTSEARVEPVLALLSARAHGHEVGGFAVIHAALAGVAGFDNGDGRMYIDLALGGLSPGRLRRFQEDLMREELFAKLPFPTPRADALIAALEENGVRKGHQRALLRVLGRRGVPLEPEQLAIIVQCRDTSTLERWLDRAVTATTATEVLGD